MKKFDNFSSALETLKQAKDQDLENEFVQDGVISKFSLQFDLGWKLMKELLKYEGDKTAEPARPEKSSRRHTPTMIGWTRKSGCKCCATATTLPISTTPH